MLNDSQQGNQRIPTGICFLDRILDGGQIPNGVHGLLGPIGSGKTTLGMMIAVEGAKREHQSNRNGKWVFVTIDQPKNQIISRAISHGAKVSRQTGIDALCAIRGQAVSPTEHCDLTKISAILSVLNKHFSVIDLFLERFAGDCSPIRCIRDSLPQHPQPIAGIVLDYAGVAISRHIYAHQLSEKRISRELRTFVADCRSELALRYACPVWVVHQLNSDANRSSPGESQNHRDAALCRTFGTELDICVVLGQVDRPSSCVQIATTKAPAQPEFPKPRLLRFHPQFATLEEDHCHRINPMTYRIELRTNRVKCDDATRQALDRLRCTGDSAEREPD